MNFIKANTITVFSKSWCPYCVRVKSLFQRLNANFNVIELDEMKDGNSIQEELTKMTKQRTVPYVFIGETFIGGCDDTHKKLNDGSLYTLLEQAKISFTK